MANLFCFNDGFCRRLEDGIGMRVSWVVERFGEKDSWLIDSLGGSFSEIIECVEGVGDISETIVGEIGVTIFSCLSAGSFDGIVFTSWIVCLTAYWPSFSRL